jgi:hypothetical protein
MPSYRGFITIIEARYKASSYLEAIPLQKVNLAAITRFIKIRITYQHGYFRLLKVDRGLKNKGELINAARELGFQISPAPAYSSKT